MVSTETEDASAILNSLGKPVILHREIRWFIRTKSDDVIPQTLAVVHRLGNRFIYKGKEYSGLGIIQELAKYNHIANKLASPGVRDDGICRKNRRAEDR